MTDREPVIRRDDSPTSFQDLREYVLVEGPKHTYLGKPTTTPVEAGSFLRLRPAYLVVDFDMWGDEQLPPNAPQGVVPGKVFMARLRNLLPLYALPSLRETSLIPGQVTELREASDAELEHLFVRWIQSGKTLSDNIMDAIEKSTSRVARASHLRGLPPPPKAH